MSVHRCPDCGALHMVRVEPKVCARCGHEAMNHNDDGGKLKKAYCTIWDGGTTEQCPCSDFVLKSGGKE